MPRSKAPIIYILLGIVIFTCLGTIYAWSVFKKPLESLFSIGSTQSGIPYMLFFLFFSLSMPVSGRLIARIGPRWLSIGGGLIVALGWIWASYSQNITQLSLSYGMMGGLGVGMIYGGPIAVSARWFPRHKGLAVGLTITGFGLSPFVTAPLAGWLISQCGVLATFRILGMAFAVIITLLSLPLRFPHAVESAVVEDSSDEPYSLRIKQLLGLPSFYVMWFTFLIGALTGLMAVGISSPIGQEIFLLDEKTAALMVSLFAIFNGGGRPLMGFLVDRKGTRFSLLFISTAIILGSALMFFAYTSALVIYLVSFSLFWLVLGGWLGIAPAATSRLYGDKNMSENYGYLFTAYGVGAIIGNLLSGYIKDSSGSYLPVFKISFILGIVSFMITLLFLKPSQAHAISRQKKVSG